jgi:hypothetical protein
VKALLTAVTRPLRRNGGSAHNAALVLPDALTRAANKPVVTMLAGKRTVRQPPLLEGEDREAYHDLVTLPSEEQRFRRASAAIIRG